MRPFLKWAGNKYRIIDEIKKLLPKGQRLIEPFAGSAAVFLNTDYDNYIVAEINIDLINLYQQLQKEGETFINYVAEFFTRNTNKEKKYYELRDTFNTTNDVRLKSALFIYLNKHCYNGLCRYNSSGGFNVPFGRSAQVYFPLDELKYFYQRSHKAEFKLADFTNTMKKAKKGDVVYCDPPYAPLSDSSNFNNYSGNGFTEQQQLQLVACAEKLASRGITVVISNHDTKFVRDAYKKAKLHEINVLRSIGRNTSSRGLVPEILAVFGSQDRRQRTEDR